MITTLTSPWTDPDGRTFTAGTVFIKQHGVGFRLGRRVIKRTVYEWTLPNGTGGESMLPVDSSPGQ